MSDGLLYIGATKEKFKKLNKENHNVEYKIREMPTNNLKKPIKPLPISQSFLNHAQIDVEEQKALDEPLSWGRLRYVQILNARAQLLAKLGEESIPFVLTESDAIWLRNPFDELFPNLNLLDDVDLVLPLNSQSGQIKGQRFAFNPMFAFETNATRLALQRMNKLLNGENSSNYLMDQDVLNQLCSSQYSGLVCRDFDRSDIADGAWLKLSETERLRAAKKVGHWPYIVNNNFYVGVHNKMAR
uniref:Nucleotide-diphospho-sugar transferase domain-containing protein n=1 Tax=Meloidogyne javanica TaxID=6303 RepID=A0A915LY45_MELJA